MNDDLKANVNTVQLLVNRQTESISKKEEQLLEKQQEIARLEERFKEVVSRSGSRSSLLALICLICLVVE
jgi:hypothetical protein